MKNNLFVVAFLTVFMLFSKAVNAKVLTSIKPLAFIANAITNGITETEVLLPNSASPHDYNLKPSDIEKLNQAKLIVWVGEGLETFLEKRLVQQPRTQVLALSEVPEIMTIVEKAAQQEQKDAQKTDHNHLHHHRHDYDHNHNHDHSKDWHIWLSSEASEVIAEQIAARLTPHYPEQQHKIADNLARFKATLANKKIELKNQLDPIKTKGYYTFHKAYGYFEADYQLSPRGAFTLNPNVTTGAKTLAKIKQNITANQAKCLFAEPQFTPRVIETLSRGTAVNVGKLDPLGEHIKISPTAYFQFLQSLADGFSQCLKKR